MKTRRARIIQHHPITGESHTEDGILIHLDKKNMFIGESGFIYTLHEAETGEVIDRQEDEPTYVPSRPPERSVPGYLLRFLQTVEKTGGRSGVTRKELMKVTGLKEATVISYISALGYLIERVGENKVRRNPKTRWPKQQ